MYKRGDIGQVARALRVLGELRGYKTGRWVNEIAAKVGASERTVRRDLGELQDAGFDIEITKRTNRVYAQLAGEQSSTVAIAKRERFTLLAIRRVFDVFKHTPFLEDVATVLEKLEQRMTTKERTEHAAFGEQFVYMPDHGTKSYAGKEDVIDAIQDGILQHRVVRYRYADAKGHGRTGYLAPFRLAMYRHGLYVIGARLKEPYSEVRGASLGVFAIERFSEAEYLKRHPFEIPEDSRVSDVLAGSFGPHLADATGPHEVIVEFSDEKAHLVSSREWHPSQKVTTLNDGRIRITLTVPSLAPIVSWILEWGPHARAVAPDLLVAQVARELRAATALYVTQREATNQSPQT
ncbi:MAG: WYL domain-containing transcriptional regulator [Deltaproteobacteria bacterium]|nr:WYL domain-containing transcriptional regulator [Deltaproteobacteria bacterium]